MQELVATDPEGTALTWSLVQQEDASIFRVDANTRLILKADNLLDFETKTSYWVDMRVTDGGGQEAETRWGRMNS